MDQKENKVQNKENINKILDFLKKTLQNQEQCYEAIKVANGHYWLHQNAEYIVEQYFSFEQIREKLNKFDATIASQIITDENYGPIENRGSIVLEIITDSIIQDIDPAIKDLYLKQQNNEDIFYPIIEYGSNIFPDINLFMVFPDLDIPLDVNIFLEKVINKITEVSEIEFKQTIVNYFKEAWPFYEQNLLHLIQNPSKINEYIIEQLYKGQEGQCYPSQKRNPIALKIIF